VSENGANRLDRIEAILGNLAAEHVQLVHHHQEFAKEHKLLLTAQVVLTERIDKLAAHIESILDAQAHDRGRLDALIAVVDDLVRREKPCVGRSRMLTKEKQFKDGRVGHVYPLTFGRARLGIGPADMPVYDNEW
jgi:hypothetical protein